MTDTIYADRRYLVTGQSLRTARKTFRLGHVEQTRLSRPGLIAGLALTGGSWSLVGVFSGILYAHEIWLLLVGPLVPLPFLARIGVLVLEYRNLGGTGRIVGWAPRLTQVRAAVDGVLEGRL